MLRNTLGRLNPRNLFVRKKKYPIPKQDVDMQTLDNFTLNVKVLSKFVPDSHHPINKVAISARTALSEESKSSSSIAYFSTIDRHLTASLNSIQSSYPAEVKFQPDAAVSEHKPEIDATVRTYFAREYFKRLYKSVNNQEINVDGLSAAHFSELLDVMLRGSASERIEAHAKLYGPEMNQERLQECFYSLYEPEVHTCASLFLSNPALHPHHQKTLPKFSKTYLLDKHDLNMKLRCVLAWTDPKFSGFETVDDATTISVDQLLKARRDFYEEGTEIGLQFMRDYIGNRNEFYNNKAENKQNMRRGAAFFVVTCLLDWLVCTI